jgi:hypothetical protein
MGVQHKMPDISDTTAIAGRISPEKLPDTLVRTSIEKAGAQRGNLMRPVCWNVPESLPTSMKKAAKASQWKKYAY